MATPTGDIIGQICDTILNSPWAGVGGGLASIIVPEVWKRLKWPTKTKYGITNEEKKYGKYNSWYYKKKKKWKMYKWISNGYRYKRDVLYELYIEDQSNVVSIRKVGATTPDNGRINTIWTMAEDLKGLKAIFDEYHMCGIAVQYKPYQIVKTDSNADNNQTPNLIMAIFTGIEMAQYGTLAQNADNIQKLTDRPFTRLIAADDDLRMYRPFKIRSNYDADMASASDEILYSWVPTNSDTGNQALYYLCLLAPAYQQNRANRWNLGTLKITLYIKFRNSKI